MADTKLFNEQFYKSFVKISAITMQQLLFVNFPHYKSIENLTCHITKHKERPMKF